ncbi:MAG TPA: hypothetical protein PK953_09845 [Smithellaceae bacterium]|jgi:hypothetical protein|nr:hypothetical protein [Smithellaceae bacterium]HQC11201.1 hypothetical protein [Smithellaceae bacterium]HQN67996.1 hypothetical protein [Smithellaceae bacterium]
MTIKNRFSESDMKAFAPSEKVGIIATVTPAGLPHLSLLTSVMASTPTQMTIGEFCKGVSKDYLQQSRKAGFAILTLDKKLWRGKALWTHLKKEGPEYEVYNQQPMFRYNTYFGINTVHYLDLKETTEGAPLPLASIAASAILTKIAKGAAAQNAEAKALSPFGKNLFDRLDSLKFLSFIDDDGFPAVIPVIQCQACDENRLAFYPGAFGEELDRLKAGKTMAIFGLTMQMEDVLVRGVFRGYARRRGIRLGTLDIDWVYNSMPPNHGQIYPPLPLKAVVHF